jgi:hypothetical protein
MPSLTFPPSPALPPTYKKQKAKMDSGIEPTIWTVSMKEIMVVVVQDSQAGLEPATLRWSVIRATRSTD